MRGLRESVEKQDEEKKKGRKKQKNERGKDREKQKGCGMREGE